MPIPPLKEDLNGDTTTQGKFKNAMGDLWDWIDKKADKSDVLNLLSADRLVTVGSGGDFATINEALVELSKSYPIYKKNGYTVEVRLKAGFVMQEQVIVNGIDLGWIRITGEDSETTIQRSSLTYQNFSGSYSAFTAQNSATLPVIAQLFTMDTSDSGHNDETCGISILTNSKGKIDTNCGVKNVVDGKGLKCYYTSKVYAESSIFTGSNFNVVMAYNSLGDFTGANLSNTNSGDCLLLTTSIAHCRYANLNDSKRFGIYATSSIVDAYQATATNTDNYSIYSANNSNIFAYGTNCSANGNSSDIEYAVSNGSMLTITAPAGRATTNVSVNTLHQQGIIFR